MTSRAEVSALRGLIFRGEGFQDTMGPVASSAS